MSEPKFQHDCTHCEFLGHYFGHDVYLCRHSENSIGPTIIARHGDQGHQYASTPLKIYRDTLTGSIEDRTVSPPQSQLYADWLFAERGSPAERAWLMALAKLKIDELVQR